MVGYELDGAAGLDEQFLGFDDEEGGEDVGYGAACGLAHDEGEVLLADAELGGVEAEEVLLAEVHLCEVVEVAYDDGLPGEPLLEFLAPVEGGCDFEHEAVAERLQEWLFGGVAFAHDALQIGEGGLHVAAFLGLEVQFVDVVYAHEGEHVFEPCAEVGVASDEAWVEGEGVFVELAGAVSELDDAVLGAEQQVVGPECYFGAVDDELSVSFFEEADVYVVHVHEYVQGYVCVSAPGGEACQIVAERGYVVVTGNQLSDVE